MNYSIYGGTDPRELPAYTLRDVAQFTAVPLPTLRSWVKGRTYPTERGPKYFEPIVIPPQQTRSQLSFFNLLEVHILSTVRREHNVPLPNVRKAIDYIGERFESQHPLIEKQFATDGIDLFIEAYGQYINASQQGQMAMREILEAYIKRIDWDAGGYPIRLFPFMRRESLEEPRIIAIDPFVSFGKPILYGTGIPIAVIAERFEAGESIDDLALDYGQPRGEIETAIRYELLAA